MFICKTTRWSFSYTIAPIMWILSVTGRILYRLGTLRRGRFLICRNSGSTSQGSRRYGVCSHRILETPQMPPCKMMISRYGRSTGRTMLSMIITVSQICSWTNLSSIWTVLDLKSTPTVILYSFRNSPCKYLWISVVLPTPLLTPKYTRFANNDNLETHAFQVHNTHLHYHFRYVPRCAVKCFVCESLSFDSRYLIDYFDLIF